MWSTAAKWRDAAPPLRSLRLPTVTLSTNTRKTRTRTSFTILNQYHRISIRDTNQNARDTETCQGHARSSRKHLGKSCICGLLLSTNPSSCCRIRQHFWFSCTLCTCDACPVVLRSMGSMAQRGSWSLMHERNLLPQ